MQAGVCGVVDGDFDVVSDSNNTITKNGHDLAQSIQVDRVFSLPTGKTGFEGTAATQKVVTQTSSDIVDGEIEISETTVKETVRTEFIGVPGELIVVENSAGVFAFDLLEDETETSIERGRIDLSGFLEEHDDGSPWKAGFYDMDGNAQKGTVYGDDLGDDGAFGPVLTDASLNQLGIRYEHRDQEFNVDLTETGFVQLYQPTGLDESEFLEYLLRDVWPYISGTS